jgi:hypothetical protein
MPNKIHRALTIEDASRKRSSRSRISARICAQKAFIRAERVNAYSEKAREPIRMLFALRMREIHASRAVT